MNGPKEPSVTGLVAMTTPNRISQSPSNGLPHMDDPLMPIDDHHPCPPYLPLLQTSWSDMTTQQREPWKRRSL